MTCQRIAIGWNREENSKMAFYNFSASARNDNLNNTFSSLMSVILLRTYTLKISSKSVVTIYERLNIMLKIAIFHNDRSVTVANLKILASFDLSMSVAYFRIDRLP